MSSITEICVHPLSGTYLPFHRYIYYISLIISVLYPTPPPLIKGTFAFSLIYSSTAALYSISILAIPNQSTINLDIFGLWAILSTASILVLPLLQWTKNLRGPGSKGARPIIRIWGVLVIIGMICSFVSMIKWKCQIDNTASNQPDLNSCNATSSNLTAPKLKLRKPTDVETAAYNAVFGNLYTIITKRISGLVFLSTVFGLLSALITITHQPPIDHQDQLNPYLSDSPIISSTSSSPSLLPALRNGFVHLRMVVVCLAPALFIPTIVVNEMYLLKDGGIPHAESTYEIGQWSIFVGAGLVAAAALVSNVAGKEKGKKTAGFETGEIISD